jgi:hypothetical protein
VSDTRLRSCYVKEIIVAEPKEAKTRCNVAESCKENYDSKRAVLPMMVIGLKVQVSYFMPFNERFKSVVRKIKIPRTVTFLVLYY